MVRAASKPTERKPPGDSANGSEPRTFDIDRIDSHDAIRINGESYRLARSSALTLVQKAALSRAWTRMTKIGERIQKGELLTDKDEREYRKLAEEITRLAVPDVPAAVVSELALEQLDQVILVFFTLTATAPSGLTSTVRELMRDRSAPTSRDSSASTAETR